MATCIPDSFRITDLSLLYRGSDGDGVIESPSYPPFSEAAQMPRKRKPWPSQYILSYHTYYTDPSFHLEYIVTQNQVLSHDGFSLSLNLSTQFL